MNQEFNSVFKTPKFTGVTLSLLSMFVLAAMFVVWEKFPKESPIPPSPKIKLLCDQRLKVPVERIIRSYKNEYNTNFEIEFLDLSDLKEIFQGNSAEESFSQVVLMAEVSEFSEADIDRIFHEKVPFAFSANSKRQRGTPSGPFVCLIGKKIVNAEEAISLARYISAPSRGQYYLAEESFIGVDGDRWEKKPIISIFSNPKLKHKLSQISETFTKREGTVLEITYKDFIEMNATISLIAKSEALEYLPDLLIGYELSQNFMHTFESIGKLGNTECLTSAHGKHKMTCKRLLNYHQKKF